MAATICASVAVVRSTMFGLLRVAPSAMATFRTSITSALVCVCCAVLSPLFDLLQQLGIESYW